MDIILIFHGQQYTFGFSFSSGSIHNRKNILPKEKLFFFYFNIS